MSNGLKKLIVFLLSALDQTIVATAMPRIIAELNGLALYSWVTTAYLLSSTVMVPIWGKLGDLFGRKPVLLAGILIFLAGSWLSGLSGEFGDLPLIGGGMVQLIVFRAIQGIGGGANRFARPRKPCSRSVAASSDPNPGPSGLSSTIATAGRPSSRSSSVCLGMGCSSDGTTISTLRSSAARRADTSSTSGSMPPWQRWVSPSRRPLSSAPPPPMRRKIRPSPSKVRRARVPFRPSITDH